MVRGSRRQLEELEDRDVAETSVVLNEDGSVTAGKTNGPIPIQVRGKWSFDGTAFRMVSLRFSRCDFGCVLFSLATLWVSVARSGLNESTPFRLGGTEGLKHTYLVDRILRLGAMKGVVLYAATHDAKRLLQYCAQYPLDQA